MRKHIFRKYLSLSLLLFTGLNLATAQNVIITVRADQNKRAVSPYLYGRNNSFDKPIQFYKDAGLRMSRMNGGNNATKYNWRKKMSSHPDWYNNVYGNDWDKTSQDMDKNFSNIQGMWAFQLLGRVASSNKYNFNDWGYNYSKYWFGVNQNLAGGGVPDTTTGSTKAKVEGNALLYTEEWPADSTVAILDHWFQPKPIGLGLNKNKFLYWNMDNEVDIWNGTHDDVMKTLLPAAEFMDRFIDVAKKAKVLFPEIKICGPVTTSEWQWYKWGSESIRINGKYYSWLEYFIKRCADEEKASGIRVLDVVDLHNYPWAKNGDVDALQLHRMYYDTEYVYAGANGLYTINGGWDTKINKEYIFKRIDDWLTLYYGENHGITCGISEWSPATNESNPSATSCAYASILGTFANHGVEYMTPWTWMNGMWETLHLFSRYAQSYSVSSTSSDENALSAYTTVNASADSMTILLVNRNMTASKTVTINLNAFSVNDGNVSTLQLSSLPTTETFKSHTDNALKFGLVSVNANTITTTLPALSVTAILLKAPATGLLQPKASTDQMMLYPNPCKGVVNIGLNSTMAVPTDIKVYDAGGKHLAEASVFYDGRTPIQFNLPSLQTGMYLVAVRNAHFTATKNLFVRH